MSFTNDLNLGMDLSVRGWILTNEKRVLRELTNRRPALPGVGPRVLSVQLVVPVNGQELHSVGSGGQEMYKEEIKVYQPTIV